MNGYHFIISLVAQYDSFLGKLIRFIFAVRPEILNDTENQLKFTQLMKFPNIEAAREFVIEKDIESVIRKSHAEQFEWLIKKLGFPLNKNLPCWATFIELTERRNLFVHTDGHVSSQYLSVCSTHDALNPREALKVGDQLGVSQNYYEEAYKCIFEISVKLAHLIWRKLCKDLIDEADDNINDITLDLIKMQEYNLSIRLLKFFTRSEMKHTTEKKRCIMLVNLAQAYKWNKNTEKCNSTLKEEDWSACDDPLKLAVATLQDNFDNACKIMKRLQHVDDFPKTNYKDWPLFQELRKNELFLQTYEHCYGEQFVLEQSTQAEKQTVDDDSKERFDSERREESKKPPAIPTPGNGSS